MICPRFSMTGEHDHMLINKAAEYAMTTDNKPNAGKSLGRIVTKWAKSVVLPNQSSRTKTSNVLSANCTAIQFIKLAKNHDVKPPISSAPPFRSGRINIWTKPDNNTPMKRLAQCISANRQLAIIGKRGRIYLKLPIR